MTRKYRVASSAIVRKMDGTLSLNVLYRIAERMINKNARKSNACVLSAEPCHLVEDEEHRRRGKALYMRPLTIYAR